MTQSPVKPKGGLAVIMAMKPKMDSKGDMADMKDPDMDGDDDTSPEGDTDNDQGKQYVVPPKGFGPPDDVPAGGSFSGTFRGHMDEDGRLCLEALNNIPLTPQKSEGDETDQTDEQDESQPDLQNAPKDINTALKKHYQ